MEILVTGGLGYIGSHTVVELLRENYEVIIADNLSNSSIDVLYNIEKITGKTPKFFEIDVKDKKKTGQLFDDYKFDAVIHFAGHKSVGESVENPLMYYENNLMTTINLSQLCLDYGVEKFIFSSSATVYGENKVPLNEEMSLSPTTNPYGETKAMCERILEDTSKVNSDFSPTILRYFNPIGAHESGLLCEQPKGQQNNLMPFIAEVARGNQKNLKVFGNDYNTKDGTGVRDYIHVVDLAKAHVLALKNQKCGLNVYNIGTGKGYSVLEIISNFEQVHNIKIPFEIVERRAGDIAECYADCTKAERELGFKTEYGILEMCKHSFKTV